MTDFLLWLSAHRIAVVVLTGGILWALGCWVYLRPDIANFIRRRQPRAWQVNIATKQAVRGQAARGGNGGKGGH